MAIPVSSVPFPIFSLNQFSPGLKNVGLPMPEKYPYKSIFGDNLTITFKSSISLYVKNEKLMTQVVYNVAGTIWMIMIVLRRETNDHAGLLQHIIYSSITGSATIFRKKRNWKVLIWWSECPFASHELHQRIHVLIANVVWKIFYRVGVTCPYSEIYFKTYRV